MAPSYEQLERAIASVPGVASACVKVSDDTGRGKLRIRLSPGEDPRSVSWAVAATLRERFGIALDPEDIRAFEGDPSEDGASDGEVRAEQVAAVEPAAAATPDAADEPPPPAVPDDATGGPDEVEVRHGSEDDDAIAVRTAEPEPWSVNVDDLDGDLDVRAALEELRRLREQDRGVATEAAEGQRAPDETEAEAAPQPWTNRDDDEAVAAAPSPGPGVPADDDGATSIDSVRSVSVDSLDSADDDVDAIIGDLPRVVRLDERRSRVTRVRAACRDLETHLRTEDVRVRAILGVGDREAEGLAIGVRTRRGVLRAVAEATVRALEQLTEGRVHAAIDQVVLVPSADVPSVTVLVQVASVDGEEAHVGAALVRADTEQAVMRATLDALNRRVEPLLLAL